MNTEIIKYPCTVTETDVASIYITDAEGGEDQLAIVLTNAQGQKISTVLSKEQAAAIRDQINLLVKP